MTRFAQTSRHINNKDSQRQYRSGWRNLFLCVWAVCFVFFIAVYLLEVNYIASRGLQMRELEQRISLAKEENDETKTRLVEMNSMIDLSGKIDGLKMVPIGEVIYFDTTGQVVARR